MGVRLDLHGVSLANARDRWYFGSGVTQKTGTAFGYGTRVSGGSTGLGHVLEGSADYAINPHGSLNGSAAAIRGGNVVRNLFAGSALSFLYIESIVQF
jgi:hypothetical protein